MSYGLEWYEKRWCGYCERVMKPDQAHPWLCSECHHRLRMPTIARLTGADSMPLEVVKR